jgi:hypothetical protein
VSVRAQRILGERFMAVWDDLIVNPGKRLR